MYFIRYFFSYNIFTFGKILDSLLSGKRKQITLQVFTIFHFRNNKLFFTSKKLKHVNANRENNKIQLYPIHFAKLR